MVIVCEHCGSAFSLPDDRIPLAGVRVTCTGCFQKMWVQPPAAVIPAGSPEDRGSGEDDLLDAAALEIPPADEEEPLAKEDLAVGGAELRDLGGGREPESSDLEAAALDGSEAEVILAQDLLEELDAGPAEGPSGPGEAVPFDLARFEVRDGSSLPSFPPTEEAAATPVPPGEGSPDLVPFQPGGGSSGTAAVPGGGATVARSAPVQDGGPGGVLDAAFRTLEAAGSGTGTGGGTGPGALGTGGEADGSDEILGVLEAAEIPPAPVEEDLSSLPPPPVEEGLPEILASDDVPAEAEDDVIRAEDIVRGMSLPATPSPGTVGSSALGPEPAPPLPAAGKAGKAAVRPKVVAFLGGALVVVLGVAGIVLLQGRQEGEGDAGARRSPSPSGGGAGGELRTGIPAEGQIGATAKAAPAPNPVAAPVAGEGGTVHLPSVLSGRAARDEVEVVLSKEGARVGGHLVPVTEAYGDGATGGVKALAAALGGKPVRVAADSSVPYSLLAPVLFSAARPGGGLVGLVGKATSGDDSGQRRVLDVALGLGAFPGGDGGRGPGDEETGSGGEGPSPVVRLKVARVVVKGGLKKAARSVERAAAGDQLAGVESCIRRHLEPPFKGRLSIRLFVSPDGKVARSEAVHGRDPHGGGEPTPCILAAARTWSYEGGNAGAESRIAIAYSYQVEAGRTPAKGKAKVRAAKEEGAGAAGGLAAVLHAESGGYRLEFPGKGTGAIRVEGAAGPGTGAKLAESLRRKDVGTLLPAGASIGIVPRGDLTAEGLLSAVDALNQGLSGTRRIVLLPPPPPPQP